MPSDTYMSTAEFWAEAEKVLLPDKVMTPSFHKASAFGIQEHLQKVNAALADNCAKLLLAGKTGPAAPIGPLALKSAIAEDCSSEQYVAYSIPFAKIPTDTMIVGDPVPVLPMPNPEKPYYKTGRATGKSTAHAWFKKPSGQMEAPVGALALAVLSLPQATVDELVSRQRGIPYSVMGVDLGVCIPKNFEQEFYNKHLGEPHPSSAGDKAVKEFYAWEKVGFANCDGISQLAQQINHQLAGEIPEIPMHLHSTPNDKPNPWFEKSAMVNFSSFETVGGVVGHTAGLENVDFGESPKPQPQVTVDEAKILNEFIFDKLAGNGSEWTEKVVDAVNDCTVVKLKETGYAQSIFGVNRITTVPGMSRDEFIYGRKTKKWILEGVFNVTKSRATTTNGTTPPVRKNYRFRHTLRTRKSSGVLPTSR